MFFRSSMRVNPKTGKLSGYYRLIESYRNINGKVCHRTMLATGFLDELTAEQLNQIQRGLNHRIEGLDNTLFAEETDPVVVAYIEQFYQQLYKRKTNRRSIKKQQDQGLANHRHEHTPQQRCS